MSRQYWMGQVRSYSCMCMAGMPWKLTASSCSFQGARDAIDSAGDGLRGLRGAWRKPKRAPLRCSGVRWNIVARDWAG